MAAHTGRSLTATACAGCPLEALGRDAQSGELGLFVLSKADPCLRAEPEAASPHEGAQSEAAPPIPNPDLSRGQLRPTQGTHQIAHQSR